MRRRTTVPSDRGVSGKIEYDLSPDFQLTSISAYREWTFEGDTDVDATPLLQPVAGVNLWDINGGRTDLVDVARAARRIG